MAFWFPSAAMFYMSIATSLPGTHYAGLANDRVWLVSLSLVAIWIALFSNMIGVKIGKWTENAGAVATWVLGALLGGCGGAGVAEARACHDVPFVAGLESGHAGIAGHRSLCGDQVSRCWASWRGRSADPARTAPRSAGHFDLHNTLLRVDDCGIAGDAAAGEHQRRLNGLAQAGGEAAKLLSAGWIAPAIAGLVVVNAIGQFGGIGSSVSRMPFAAGVDHLLPAAFAKIHPRWATPYISILTFGVLSSLLLIGSQFGDTLRGAYQTLVSLMVIAGFLPYVYVFGSAWKSGRRVSAFSGWSINRAGDRCIADPHC